MRVWFCGSSVVRVDRAGPLGDVGGGRMCCNWQHGSGVEPPGHQSHVQAREGPRASLQFVLGREVLTPQTASPGTAPPPPALQAGCAVSSPPGWQSQPAPQGGRLQACTCPSGLPPCPPRALCAPHLPSSRSLLPLAAAAAEPALGSSSWICCCLKESLHFRSRPAACISSFNTLPRLKGERADLKLLSF